MEDIQTTINEQRLLVFIETTPQSNKYNQILFTPEEFKKISDNIGVILNKSDDQIKSGFEMIEINQSEEIYTLPDLQSVYENPNSPTSITR